MFIAALFVKAIKWKQSNIHQLTDEQINKMSYKHKMEYPNPLAPPVEGDSKRF